MLTKILRIKKNKFEWEQGHTFHKTYKQTKRKGKEKCRKKEIQTKKEAKTQTDKQRARKEGQKVSKNSPKIKEDDIIRGKGFNQDKWTFYINCM